MPAVTIGWSHNVVPNSEFTGASSPLIQSEFIQHQMINQQMMQYQVFPNQTAFHESKKFLMFQGRS